MTLRWLKEGEIQGFSLNFLLHGLVYQNLGSWIRFMLIKVEIHTLTNDLRKNCNKKPYGHEFEEVILVLSQLFS
jgi:hypothetical protein